MPLSKVRVKAAWAPDPSQLKSGIVFLPLQYAPLGVCV